MKRILSFTAATWLLAASAVGAARLFTTGTTDGLLRTGYASLDQHGAQTACAWIYPTQTAQQTRIYQHGDHASGSPAFIEFALRTTATGKVALDMQTSSATGATTVTLSTWQHVCGSWGGTGDTAKVWLNGVGDGISAAAATLTHTNSDASIGYSPAFATQVFGGRIAEVAVWNVQLATEDFDSLARGAKAWRVRRDSLRAYWPLVGRNAPEPDFRGGADMVVTGTTYATPPRLF